MQKIKEKIMEQREILQEAFCQITMLAMLGEIRFQNPDMFSFLENSLVDVVNAIDGLKNAEKTID